MLFCRRYTGDVKHDVLSCKRDFFAVIDQIEYQLSQRRQEEKLLVEQTKDELAEEEVDYEEENDENDDDNMSISERVEDQKIDDDAPVTSPTKCSTNATLFSDMSPEEVTNAIQDILDAGMKDKDCLPIASRIKSSCNYAGPFDHQGLPSICQDNKRITSTQCAWLLPPEIVEFALLLKPLEYATRPNYDQLRNVLVRLLNRAPSEQGLLFEFHGAESSINFDARIDPLRKRLGVAVPSRKLSAAETSSTTDADCVWKEMKGAGGRMFYQNKFTKEVTWDKPKELMTDDEKKGIGVWRQFGEKDKPYYYNIVTKKTTWKKPADFDGPAGLGAREGKTQAEMDSHWDGKSEAERLEAFNKLLDEMAYAYSVKLHGSTKFGVWSEVCSDDIRWGALCSLQDKKRAVADWQKEWDAKQEQRRAEKLAAQKEQFHDALLEMNLDPATKLEDALPDLLKDECCGLLDPDDLAEVFDVRTSLFFVCFFFFGSPKRVYRSCCLAGNGAFCSCSPRGP